MLKFLLGSLLAALLATAATAQSSRPASPQETTRTQQQSPADQRGTDQAPFVIKVLPSPYSEKKTAEAGNNQPQKANGAWSLSDKIAVIASFVAFLQFGALILTVVVMVINGRRQLRAYVLPESGSLLEGMMIEPNPMPEHANEPGVGLSFKNSGQTPAYKYVSWASIAVVEPSQEQTLIPPAHLELHNAATIGASGTISKWVWFGRPLTADEIADIRSTKKAIFAYGRIEYVDAFRRRRWAVFRLAYAGTFPPPKGVTFVFADTGNGSN